MTLLTQPTNKSIYGALMNVKDPEIDTVSIIDLGMVENVTVEERRVSCASANISRLSSA